MKIIKLLIIWMMKIIIMKISIKFNENNEVYLQKKKKKWKAFDYNLLYSI